MEVKSEWKSTTKVKAKRQNKVTKNKTIKKSVNYQCLKSGTASPLLPHRGKKMRKYRGPLEKSYT